MMGLVVWTLNARVPGGYLRCYGTIYPGFIAFIGNGRWRRFHPLCSGRCCIVLLLGRLLRRLLWVDSFLVILICFFRTSDYILILHEKSSTSEFETRSCYPRSDGVDIVVGVVVVIAVIVAPLLPECSGIEHAA
jgi:hypothetical protein